MAQQSSVGKQRRVVVIGGGVVGSACAYYLSRQGWDVTIVEQNQFGRGCSHGNCGYVSPSHVLPHAQPGAIWPVLRTMLRRNSPFKIHARPDPALWSWLLGFARRCNEPDMLESAGAIAALLKTSRRLFDELFAAEAFDCDWEKRGLLFVFKSRDQFEHYAEIDRLLRDKFATPAVRYNEQELLQREPALKPGIAGAWFYDCDAHLRSDKLMASWRRVLTQRGVTIREGCKFLAFRRSGKHATVVETSGGDHPADAVVVAAGAWTPQLTRQLGCRIPIQPGKGYSITMPRPALCPKYPMIFEEHRVAITPFPSGYRVGSTMEFAGYDATLNPRRLELLRDGAKLYLHDPLTTPVFEEWWGWRPMIYDGRPVIGFAPAFENVLIAAGHGMLGLSMSTGTGKLAAEMLAGETPHLDPRPYSATRF
jgi:D-amino-acid dehydrogenase